MKKVLFVILFLFSLNAAANTAEPLEADEAFQLSLMAKDDQTIIVQWKIAPDYYLYRERIHFTPANPEATRFGKAWFPNGVNKTDPELGTYQVYENQLQVILPVTESTEGMVTLTVDYQGCSQAGYCYPPTEKVFRVNLADDYLQPTPALNIDLPHPTRTAPSQQDKISQLLSAEHPLWALLAFFGFGLLISLTPCVLPMIPILSSILLGQKNLTQRHAFLLSLSYVFGMALTYAVIGIIFGLLGSNLQILFQKPIVIIGFSLIFIAMALSLFGLYDLQLPHSLSTRIQDISGQQRRGTYLGALIMGVLATLIVSPCVTAPLVGALAFISESGSLALGGASLFALGLGMGIPLLILGTTGHLFFKTGAWMNRVKQFLGLVMLGVAVYMLARILPPKITLVLWAILSIATGLLLGALRTAPKLGNKISKAIGLLFCIYGLALGFSLIAGNTNPLHPWINQKPATAEINFITVKNLTEVKQQVAAANGKPILLDFYADWCVACKEMDRVTFSNPEVQRILRHWVVLRADVTANDEQDKNLSRFYHVIAPPTMVFFSSAGKNLSKKTLVGEVSAAELVDHLEEIK